ncbi:MAG: hypothetical protein KDA46_12260 [Parvularculaceae bacterium]|nr:hypothetical protein [Parvularculaceae bacterium]
MRLIAPGASMKAAHKSPNQNYDLGYSCLANRLAIMRIEATSVQASEGSLDASQSFARRRRDPEWYWSRPSDPPCHQQSQLNHNSLKPLNFDFELGFNRRRLDAPITFIAVAVANPAGF